MAPLLSLHVVPQDRKEQSNHFSLTSTSNISFLHPHSALPLFPSLLLLHPHCTEPTVSLLICTMPPPFPLTDCLSLSKCVNHDFSGFLRLYGSLFSEQHRREPGAGKGVDSTACCWLASGGKVAQSTPTSTSPVRVSASFYTHNPCSVFTSQMSFSTNSPNRLARFDTYRLLNEKRKKQKQVNK